MTWTLPAKMSSSDARLDATPSAASALESLWPSSSRRLSLSERGVERDVAVEPLLDRSRALAPLRLGRAGRLGVREEAPTAAPRAWGVVEDVDASRAAGDHGH